MPEMQSHGLISGAKDLSPPSIATMTQSQGDPSRENARRGTDSSVLIFSAISVCSSKAMSSLRVSFIPTADCSVRGLVWLSGVQESAMTMPDAVVRGVNAVVIGK